MNSLVIKFLLSCALVQVSYGLYPNPQNVANLFFRSRMGSQNPATSMACFSNYIAKSNEVGEGYGNDFNQCLVDTRNGRKAIEVEMDGKRIDIEANSQAICKRLSTCDGLNTTIEVFNCHAKIGANNTKAVYSISGNASEYANLMQEKYRIIDLRHDQCCKTAERRYIESTADNYRNLQDCLEGHVKPLPPTTTTTTTTPQPTTSSSSTSAPESSTTEIELSSILPATIASVAP